MKAFGKILAVLTYILLLLNGLIFLGTVITMLKGWIGFFAYIAGWFVAPILSPAIIALPWFDAWVTGEPVSDRLVAIWGALVVCLILRGITWKWAPDNN